jgi:hypothetical protein
MKVLLALVVLAGLGYLGYRQFLAPDVRACRQFASLCSLENEARDHCVEQLGELDAKSGAGSLAKLNSCLGEAESCPGASGCMAAAGLRASGNAIQQFFKGLGKGLE